jgi:hypothetical protein
MISVIATRTYWNNTNSFSIRVMRLSEQQCDDDSITQLVWRAADGQISRDKSMSPDTRREKYRRSESFLQSY